MNLGDPELELIDPTPNIHMLFVHFDKLFFWTKLANRAVVRWSKRMYSCAGVCSYEGRGGLCDIAVSEPLLKLRPRKDLVETLLHEMIHAYLFITNNDKDRDGHGPNFQSHMHRINKFAGLNISIYHSFHEEVELYQTHWWRCDGPCQNRKPYFGIIRRSMNKAPGPSDFWWDYHQKKCGGTFVKTKEPEKPVKKTSKAKPNADITKYITNNNIPKINGLKDCNNIPVKSNLGTLSNSSSTVLVTNKGNVLFNPKVSNPVKSPVLFNGNGHILSGIRNRSNSVSAAETVRNIWANKQLPGASSTETINVDGKVIGGKNLNPNKHKADAVHFDTPPKKMKKIEDYFKNNASAILKDVYGADFRITQSDNNKLKAVNSKVGQKHSVDCPVCRSKVNSDEINRHLDECLNKDVIAQMSTDSKEKIEIGTNEALHNKEEAQNEMNRLVAECLSNAGEKVFDCIDLTGNIYYPNTDLKTNKIVLTNKMEKIKFHNTKLGIDDVCFVNKLDVDEVNPNVKNTKYDNNSQKFDDFVLSKTEKEIFNRELGLKSDFLPLLGVSMIGPNLHNEQIDLNTLGVGKAKPILKSTKNDSKRRNFDNLVKSKTNNEIFNVEPGCKTDILNSLTTREELTSNSNLLDSSKKGPNLHDITFNDCEVQSILNHGMYERNRRKSDVTPKIKNESQIKVEPSPQTDNLNNIKIKKEPTDEKIDLICPCCGKKVQKPVAEHLEVCIGFFNNNTGVPEEGTSNFSQEAIVIDDDDDDLFDETQTLNATGTKYPCPCCFKMIEEAIMNVHLDTCLK